MLAHICDKLKYHLNQTESERKSRLLDCLIVIDFANVNFTRRVRVGVSENRENTRKSGIRALYVQVQARMSSLIGVYLPMDVSKPEDESFAVTWSLANAPKRRFLSLVLEEFCRIALAVEN